MNVCVCDLTNGYKNKRFILVEHRFDDEGDWESIARAESSIQFSPSDVYDNVFRSQMLCNLLA